ncbi:hypothetical protein CPB83DRAFT_885718 [Crepidotus variabilis]|uniref:G domain-containing protein n=1 Tax=Crepidotus variabilis TaxID=179855 RepID=A0A9P6JLG7_9AGAR|nr:hypothetical protein CPB83DRAFT_885718 [Crepidotus variabilis]
MAATEEVIIAIMGSIGSGKSQIIDLLAGTNGAGAGLTNHGNDQVEIARLKLKRRDNGHDVDVVLLDTPGFDDTGGSDMETLDKVSNWLVSKYPKGTCLAGILYLHRITDNRMTAKPHQNLRLFGKLCGGNAEVEKKLIFVTTMWDKLRDQSLGVSREKNLKEVLTPLLNFTPQLRKSHNTKENAHQLVLEVVERPRGIPVLLAEELVNQDRSLKESQAAHALYTQYQELLEQHRASIAASLECAAESPPDPSALADLEAERLRIEREVEKTFLEAKKLKLGFFQRLFAWWRSWKSVGV